MRKLFKTGLFAGAITTVFASATFAANDSLGSGTALGNISSNVTNFDNLIKLLLQLAVAAAILWTLFHLIKAGLTYTGAGADAGKKKEALGSVISAVVGLVIVLLSLVILYFVGGFVGVNPDTAVKTIKDFGPCTSKDGQSRGVKVRCTNRSCGTNGQGETSDPNAPVFCKFTRGNDTNPTYEEQ